MDGVDRGCRALVVGDFEVGIDGTGVEREMNGVGVAHDRCRESSDGSDGEHHIKERRVR